MKQKIKMLLMTSRPLSWVNTAYPFAAGYLLLGGGIDATLVIGTLFFLIPYNLLMYGINDVFDYESDMRNPRKGGVEGAVTPKSQHRLIVTMSIVSVVPFVLFLALAGTVAATAVLLALLFFVVAYSAKRLRFKEIPFLDSVTSSIHFVGPLVYALALLGFPVAAWPFVVAFFLWGIASQAFGAVQDIVPDRDAHIRSIATVLGARFTVYFSTILYLVAAGIVILQGGVAVLIGVTGLLYAASALQFVRITDKTSAQAHKGWKRFLWLNYVTGAVVTMMLITISPTSVYAPRTLAEVKAQHGNRIVACEDTQPIVPVRLNDSDQQEIAAEVISRIIDIPAGTTTDVTIASYQTNGLSATGTLRYGGDYGAYRFTADKLQGAWQVRTFEVCR